MQLIARDLPTSDANSAVNIDRWLEDALFENLTKLDPNYCAITDVADHSTTFLYTSGTKVRTARVAR